MQDIEHDMDELLRKAAADYPLRVNESNWDFVARQLNVPVAEAGVKKSAPWYRRGLFIFFFLFTGGMLVNREPQHMPLAASAYNPPADKVERAQQAVNTKPNNSKTISYSAVYINRNKTESTTEHYSTIAEITAVRTALTPPVAPCAAISVYYADAPGKESAPLDKSMQQKNTFRKNRGRFYAGLVVGPEGSQVKGQVVSKWGFDGGLIAGYNFNRRLSLETGVLFTKKHYMTEGRYFNMEMPGMKLESVHGNITIIEFPLLLKYNLVRSHQWNLFSTAGISSYLLADETNNYQLLVNGTRQNMVSSYDNGSKYFAAAVSLGLGYELKASERLRLRLQPYLKIPLRGIGVGTVPVQSMGAHAGFTYTFR